MCTPEPLAARVWAVATSNVAESARKAARLQTKDGRRSSPIVAVAKSVEKLEVRLKIGGAPVVEGFVVQYWCRYS